mmetsp:Transcript_3854/g.9939  ORF Transcript_3854/g.9939 Transcript_3854/m.9939 type:complete len:207 (-) Transcript_3854:591-1211(-)
MPPGRAGPITKGGAVDSKQRGRSVDAHTPGRQAPGGGDHEGRRRRWRRAAPASLCARILPCRLVLAGALFALLLGAGLRLPRGEPTGAGRQRRGGRTRGRHGGQPRAGPLLLCGDAGAAARGGGALVRRTASAAVRQRHGGPGRWGAGDAGAGGSGVPGQRAADGQQSDREPLHDRRAADGAEDHLVVHPEELCHERGGLPQVLLL